MLTRMFYGWSGVCREPCRLHWGRWAEHMDYQAMLEIYRAVLFAARSCRSAELMSHSTAVTAVVLTAPGHDRAIL